MERRGRWPQWLGVLVAMGLASFVLVMIVATVAIIEMILGTTDPHISGGMQWPCTPTLCRRWGIECDDTLSLECRALAGAETLRGRDKHSWAPRRPDERALWATPMH